MKKIFVVFATCAKAAGKPTIWQTDGTKNTRQMAHILLIKHHAGAVAANHRKPK